MPSNGASSSTPIAAGTQRQALVAAVLHVLLKLLRIQLTAAKAGVICTQLCHWIVHVKQQAGAFQESKFLLSHLIKVTLKSCQRFMCFEPIPMLQDVLPEAQGLTLHGLLDRACLFPLRFLPAILRVLGNLGACFLRGRLGALGCSLLGGSAQWRPRPRWASAGRASDAAGWRSSTAEPNSFAAGLAFGPFIHLPALGMLEPTFLSTAVPAKPAHGQVALRARRISNIHSRATPRTHP
mmetsp:Transcript_63406/g.151516  ORF Transcript_63406/g.151516 Transcript_63406/m.151516 type:complete len:238 (+) Transcript_63406:498-1211(+)